MDNQATISAEIAALSKEYDAGGTVETQPRVDYPPYRSSLLRHPTKDLHQADPEGVELWAPVFGARDVDPLESNLTSLHDVRVNGGRYVHQRDQHPAALDPHFTGMGRCLTDDNGTYAFTTIKPGPYPWRNHRNAWRPAHIHFSLFGTEFTQRMVTQMYFPGDPLFELDPIYQSILDPAARARLVATYDHDLTQPEWCTGYRWDIVLTGAHRTVTEDDTEGGRA